jgi:hypothetical protein
MNDDYEFIFNLFFKYIPVISIPLAMWKMIEIVVWLFKHVTISITGG